MIHRKAVTVKIRLEKAAPSPSGLVLGVSVHGPRDSWIRFALLEVPYSELPATLVDDYWSWADRDSREWDDDDALPLDWGTS